MRVNCRPPHRSLTGQLALAAVAAWFSFSGCQTPPFDHTASVSSGLTAKEMPTVARNDPPAAGTPSESTRSADNVAKPSTASASAETNEALIVENLNLGHREAALNRLEQAEAYYRRVLAIQPDNLVANHRLAVIADKRHDYAGAEHYYLTALHREPRDPDVLSDLGYSYLLQGRRDESERCLMAATRLDPSHGKALHNLSLLYAANGDYDHSFDALRRALGESEARVKIAALFPKGRPQSNENEAVVASFQPLESDGRTAATVDTANSTAPAGPVATTAAGSAPQISSSRPTIGRVPENEINDRFAAIDREPAPASAKTSSSAPTSSATQTAMAANGAAPAQAAPGTDPLASMPLWSPGGSTSQPGKPRSAFEFDDHQPPAAQAPPPQRPRVVVTDITPAEDLSKPPTILSRRDALSAFDAELQKEKAQSSGRADSNGIASRDPLIVDRTQDIPADPSKPSANPAPFNSAPVRIQPRSTPVPLFEPLDDFGPGNDFAPSDKVAVPAWPTPNGGVTAPAANGQDPGPAIRPGSPD